MSNEPMNPSYERKSKLYTKKSRFSTEAASNNRNCKLNFHKHVLILGTKASERVCVSNVVGPTTRVLLFRNLN